MIHNPENKECGIYGEEHEKEIECEHLCSCTQEAEESVDWEKAITPLLQRTWANNAGYYDWLDFIHSCRAQAVKERDEFWKAQEMGKSSDCAKHERQAVEEYKKRLLKNILTIINETK